MGRQDYEGDDALRSGQFSPTPEVTNRLLVLMDGIEQRVQDVVFIAATNHPEDLDPALLRAGRFTEKVEFRAPSREHVAMFVEDWARERGVVLVDFDAQLAAIELAGETIANVEGILQYALNRAIDVNVVAGRTRMSMADLRAALGIVSPAERKHLFAGTA